MEQFFEVTLYTAWTQCWQVTLLIVAVWSTVRYVARNRPHLASVLWLVVLIKCVTPPLWSSPGSIFSWLQAQSVVSLTQPASLALDTIRDSSPVDGIVVHMPRPGDAQLATQNTLVAPPSAEISFWRRTCISLLSWGGLLTLTWLFGCLGFAAIACGRWALCWSRLRRAGTADAPEVVQLAASLSQKLGLRWPVRVVVSRSPVGPAVVGILRPIVILPSLIVDAKSLKELEPLLAHEMIHIRRGDLWVGLLQLLAQGLWWFHPLVRLVNRWSTREAERCCDEEVIARLGCEPGQYARSLIDVLALKRTLYPIPAFPGVRPVDVTSQRLERIMKLGHGCHKRTPHWCWLVMLLAVSATLPGAALIVADDKVPGEAEQISPNSNTHPRPIPAAATATQEEVEELASTEPNVVRVYNVEDVVKRIINDVRLDDSDARQMLLQLVQEAVGPASGPVSSSVSEKPAQSWQDLAHRQKPEVTWAKTALVIRHTPAGHERIANRLHDMRENGFTEVQVEVRMLSGKAANVEGLKLEWKVLNAASSVAERGQVTGLERPAPTPVTPPNTSKIVDEFRQNVDQAIRGEVKSVLEKHRANRVAIVDSARANAIIQQAQADPRTNVIQAPRIILFSGQNASISDQMHRPFVVAFERQNNVSKPVIRTLADGWEMHVLPKLLDERDNLFSLKLNLSLSQIVDVKKAAYSGDELRPMSVVQCPEVESMKLEATLELKGDQTLVIGDMTRKSRNEDEPFLLLINVKKVLPEDNSRTAKAQPEPMPREIVPVAATAEPTSNGGKYLTALAQDFAKRERELHDRKLETRVYNVADLVIPIPGYTPSTQQQERVIAEGRERPQVRLDYGALLELIATTIDPNSWDVNGGKATIKAFDKTVSLVIKQSTANHERIQNLFARMRTFQDLQVSFYIERVTLTKSEFEQWLEKTNCPGVQKLKAGEGGVAFPLSDIAVKWIHDLSSARVKADATITYFNGQHSQVPAELMNRDAGCIEALHLLPIVSPTFDQIHINVGVAKSSDKKAQQMELVTVPRGEALLVDLLEQSWSKQNVGVPILDKIPYLDRVFKNTSPEPPAERQFLLLTPKVMLVQEVEAVR